MPQHATRTSFQPGWKGGPGRPRKDVAVPTANAVCKLARSFSQEALETLVKMMRNAELPGNVRIKAAEAVLNRGIGLPAVAVDVTVQRVLAKKLCECTIDELRAIEQHLAEQAIDVTPAAETPSAAGS
jgi:endonuclease III